MKKNTTYVDNPFESPAILSVCPGFLGLERGLARAIGKIRTVAYVEIEAFIVANLISGMETGMVDAAPVWTDVKTFQALPFRNKIHGIIGGYPCQPFSLAGDRKGTDDPRHLWPYISGIIKTINPLWCLFENVGGHLSMGYDTVYRELRQLGYVVEAGIFTASEVGAPHERERLFILAISGEFISHTRRKRIRWQAWTNINWSCTGAAVDVSESFNRGLQLPGRRSEQDNTEFIGAGENQLANSNDNGSNGSENGQSIDERSNGDTSGQNNVFKSEGCNLASLNEGLETNNTDKGLANTISQPGQSLTTTRLDMEWLVFYKTRRNENTNGSESFSENGKLANAPCFRCEGPQRNGNRKDRGKNGTNRWGSFGPYGTIATPAGDEQQYLSNTVCFNGEEIQTETRHTIIGSQSISNGNTGRTDRWPSRPGERQYDWEEPRTVESKMGSVINGYNFREDLLRAYGNSVVEQTAEVAFVSLLKKHIRNIELAG